jgi:hypothetical protein
MASLLRTLRFHPSNVPLNLLWNSMMLRMTREGPVLVEHSNVCVGNNPVEGLDSRMPYL